MRNRHTAVLSTLSFQWKLMRLEQNGAYARTRKPEISIDRFHETWNLSYATTRHAITAKIRYDYEYESGKKWILP